MEPVVFIRKCRAWPRGVKQSDAKVVTRCGVRNRGNAPLSVDFRLVFRRCSRLIVRTLGELPAAVRENVLCNIIWALGEYFEEFLDPGVGDRRFLSHDELSKDQRVFFGINLVASTKTRLAAALFLSRGFARGTAQRHCWASLG